MTKTHGGKREGAGRKPTHKEGRTERVFANIPETLVRKLEAYAASKGLSRSAALTEAVRRLTRRM